MGGEPVPSCCFLDRDRHTVKVEIQDCTDDNSARRWAQAGFRRLAQDTLVELRRDRRLVERRERAQAVRQ